MTNPLSREIFTTVLRSTPLVSIDLIVINEHQQVLLGKRLNRPAQGYWFVPGGRIFKSETQEQAFARISLAELGAALEFADSQLVGTYDHIYDDNVFGEDFTTHYVALGRKLQVESSTLNLNKELPKDEQHSDYCWLSVAELLQHPMVHKHTKNYFL